MQISLTFQFLAMQLNRLLRLSYMLNWSGVSPDESVEEEASAVLLVEAAPPQSLPLPLSLKHLTMILRLAAKLKELELEMKRQELKTQMAWS